VAVLFSGQLRPKAGSSWPTGLIQTDYLGATDSSASVESLSRDRIAKLADYGITKEQVEQAIAQDQEGRFKAVGPGEVEQVLSSLDIAARHLSGLATRTYELERFRLASLVRFEFSKPLTSLKKEELNLQDRLDEVRQAMLRLSSFVGLEFAALCCVHRPGRVEVMRQIGLDDILHGDNNLVFEPSDVPTGTDDRSIRCREVALSKRRDIRVVDELGRRYETAGHNNPTCLCVNPKETLDFMLALGKSVSSQRLEFTESEIEISYRIASVACLVTGTLCLLSYLRYAQKAMDHFIEDVAHDIRAPLQDIIVKAAMLKRVPMQPQEFTTQAGRLAAAVMRIDLVARRVWTVQLMQRGELIYKDTNTSVRETVSKVVDTLVDVSRREGVEVSPEWDSFDNLPNLFLDRNVFFEAVLNLIDNAIKYSAGPIRGRRPQVIIKAWQTPAEVVLSVGNRGIEISKEERSLIFERYYRTTQAKRVRPDGSGRLTGVLLCKRLRLAQPSIPIVVVTSLSDPKAHFIIKIAGANDIIEKPAYPDDIVHRLQRLLRQEQQR
jgi:CheY-like chemotaxis protein